MNYKYRSFIDLLKDKEDAIETESVTRTLADESIKYLTDHCDIRTEAGEGEIIYHITPKPDAPQWLIDVLKTMGIQE